MKTAVMLALLGVAIAISVGWTLWRVFGHLTGSGVHLDGAERTAYEYQMRGYKAERRGDLQVAADEYAEALRLDPTNAELAARRARILELIAEQNGNV